LLRIFILSAAAKGALLQHPNNPGDRDILLLIFYINERYSCCKDSTIMRQSPKLDLLPGTVDLLILRTLQFGQPQHGWSISERIQQISQDILRVNQGSLYPALHRLEHQGWIKAEWGVSELGRRARFYRLTASGRKQLEVEKQNWAHLAGAIGRVLEMA
jgi:PadR family transcriptional regulator, regulatory protein PadR